MISQIKESRLASMLAWGSLLVTVVITDRISSEPANLGKLIVLAGLGFGVLPILVPVIKSGFTEARWLFSALVVFLSAALVSILLSSNPFERGFYGAFGRNTGFLSYFLLAVVFLAAFNLRSSQSFKKLRDSLFATGLINLSVCLLAVTGNDIFTWSNPSNAIMGTFGNSNFIGAFLGFFSGILFVNLAEKFRQLKSTLFTAGLLLVNLFVIMQTKALQGLVVFLIMGALTCYFFLRSRPELFRLSQAFLSLSSLGVLVGFLGVLNKGPLSSLLYKPSVTFRGEYWMAGINMGLEKIFTGLGMDSYGAYYRTFRNESAVKFPGVDVTTDAAHNVVIDIFSGTGIFGVLSYLFIVIFVLKSAIVYIRLSKTFDPKFLTLFLPWLGYQIQSIVSINQLGLAIWGWLLGGAVIAYTKSNVGSRQASLDDDRRVFPKAKSKSQIKSSSMLPASTALTIYVSVIAGVLIALPPFVADARMRTILNGNSDSATLISHVKSFPLDINRLNRGVVVLANSGLNVLAAELAIYGTTRFPNDYSSWYSLYELSGPGTPDAEPYRKKLHEIDPFNPKYFEK